MNVLIVGLGSIAKKHIDALKKVTKEVKFYALRSGSDSEKVDGVIDIHYVNDNLEVDFVMITNPTAFHAAAIKQVVDLKKPMFIEKPPFHNLDDADSCLKLVKQKGIMTYTAFNLRFLDCLKYLKQHVILSEVQEVNVYCGSYLPNWRTNTDYKKNYSANAAMGGGVHLDLIHELDYVLWIFGKPVEVRSVLRSCSKLEIQAVDYANYVLVYQGFVVNVVLNYYRKDTKRSCEIVFDCGTWNIDLINNTVFDVQHQRVLFQSKQKVLDTYSQQMEYFCESVLKNQTAFNSLEESIETLKISLA